MSYNVITVGTIDDNNTTSYSDDTIWSKSSYNSDYKSSFAMKPDIVAPGVKIAYSNIISREDPNKPPNTGTSFAAPHVTAVVAQLCQKNSKLKLQQDTVKAIVTAGIRSNKHRNVPYQGTYDQIGAGLIDAQSSVYIASHGQFASSSFSGSQKEYSKTFTVSSSDSIKRISLAFLKYNTATSSGHLTTSTKDKLLADLDLSVYRKKSDGTWTFVSSSLTNRNNVEIVQINNPIAGQYKLVVKRYDKDTSIVYFGVAWW